MPDTVSQPRLLLRRLRQVMAGQGDAQDRLDQLVKLVAQYMVAEVCSVYVSRAGGVLELFATEGLNPGSVHNIRMQSGEGLVGLVAERGLPLNLSDAPQHPRFRYFQETGEEVFHSFLGVPVRRAGQVAGVLVVQNVTPRRYSGEEVEVMQTIAMVIAELIASDELVNREELSEASRELGAPLVLDGRKLADGLAAGIAVFHVPRARITRTIADDVEAERIKLENAIAQLRIEMEELVEHPDLAHGGEHRAVLETYRMFAYDEGWQNKMRAAVATGLTAEAAVDRAQQENRSRMMKIRDPYLRDRIRDLEGLSVRLIRTLQGRDDSEHAELTEDSVLIAHDISPADLIEYSRERLKGIALAEGSPSSHVSIVARALGIAMIGRVSGLLEHLEPGDSVIVDTQTEHLFVRPAEDVWETYARAVEERGKQLATYAAERDLPAITQDGVEISLMMNAGLLVDLPQVKATGADGIGLFRTEFQFMVSPVLPRVDEQERIYAKVLDAVDDKPVIFRTLDIGGDKQVPFLPRDVEENPAMGWRASRVALDRPALLRYQLRGLLYASRGRPLSIMFPMIAEVSEWRRSRDILSKELSRLVTVGRPTPASVRLGCMLEVPSLVWQLPELLEEVDFLSIGTNDLLQFFFACDRSNPRLTDRYDVLSPAVLRFLKDVIGQCHAADVEVTLCGEMGSKPLEALALIGIGLRRLSLSSGAIGPVKQLIRSTNFASLEQFVSAQIANTEYSIRDTLFHYVRDHTSAP